MHLVKKVTKKNIRSGFISLTPDEMLDVCNKTCTIEVKTYRGRTICKRKSVTDSMRKAALENKVSIDGTKRSYYLMPY